MSRTYLVQMFLLPRTPRPSDEEIHEILMEQGLVTADDRLRVVSVNGVPVRQPSAEEVAEMRRRLELPEDEDFGVLFLQVGPMPAVPPALASLLLDLALGRMGLSDPCETCTDVDCPEHPLHSPHGESQG